MVSFNRHAKALVLYRFIMDLELTTELVTSVQASRQGGQILDFRNVVISQSKRLLKQKVSFKVQ
jgi:hypothetical protein